MRTLLKFRFVEFIPSLLEEGVLYITVVYKTAVHLCACGCGNEVVTPITRTDWRLTFDGKSISLFPSIGNWSFDCKSHYWIKKNKVVLAPSWSDFEIDFGRQKDVARKEKYFKKGKKK
ncbi:MAG: hypothetical protein EOP48_14240 [Sphingobacteriales bacterium]|nr:MAG: hypothetical protein EOP48_14240 [Sphingobacteriales bacterium]